MYSQKGRAGVGLQLSVTKYHKVGGVKEEKSILSQA
jgi:hypothetical protein